MGCDVLEEYGDVVGRRGMNGGSAELEGGATVYLYSVETFTFAVFIYCTSSRTYIMAVSEASCGFDVGCVR